jgi:hypothetical protein
MAGSSQNCGCRHECHKNTRLTKWLFGSSSENSKEAPIETAAFFFKRRITGKFSKSDTTSWAMFR